MAIINLNKKRKSSGGYDRLIGDSNISNLVTSIHSASISTGTQVSERLEWSYEGDLPIFSGKDVNTPNKTLKVIENNPKGVIIFNGYVKGKGGKKQEIDVIVYDGNVCYLGEIKDGNSLDTKKSSAEINGIISAINYMDSKGYNSNGNLILMHIENNQHSIKDDRAMNYIQSGEDFCIQHSFSFDKFNGFQVNQAPINKKIVLDEFERILREHGRL